MFALMFVITGFAKAADVISITDCGTLINQSGRDYRLDVNCQRTLLVEGDNIDLNLNGHTVLGPSTNAPCNLSEAIAGISVTGSHAQIFNGIVRGFFFGLQVFTNDNTLSELTVTENCQGLAIKSENSHISYNNISGNKHDGVILRSRSSKNEFTFNTINNNHGGN